ncbi:MAG TPA: NAD-dependent epimerase/dehydratase family protein [Candidatus Eisenbacteria bacterium]
MKRILVTGGAGFIGSHLVESLLERGHEVRAVDNLSTGRLSNIRHLTDHPRFHFTEGTVLDPELVERLVVDVDQIFHLAASVGVRYVVDNPLLSLKNNIHGAEVILDAAVPRKVPVVLFSSSEVYGKGHGGPLHEDDDRILGATRYSRWGYAASKSVDEFLAFAYHREMGLPIRLVRCFNTCGPRQVGSYGMVIPRFVEQALDGRDITIYGNGEQSRCFSFVGDVVRGVLMLADHPEANGQVFNIGTDEEVTVRELAGRIVEKIGSDSRLEFIDYKDAFGPGFEDMPRRVPDLSRINGLVGYRPEVSLDRLLDLTIENIRAERGMESPARNAHHVTLPAAAGVAVAMSGAAGGVPVGDGD